MLKKKKKKKINLISIDWVTLGGHGKVKKRASIQHREKSSFEGKRGVSLIQIPSSLLSEKGKTHV